jgi:hypothetical protein
MSKREREQSDIKHRTRAKYTVVVVIREEITKGERNR